MMKKRTAASIMINVIKWCCMFAVLLMIVLYVTDCPAQTCDPTTKDYNPTPVFTCGLLGEGTVGYGLHYRPVGTTEWTLVADIWCVWYVVDEMGNVLSSYVSLDDCLADPRTDACRRWCAIDQTGVPAQRIFELAPGTDGEWAATAWNDYGRSGYSNIVSLCWPYTCDPAVDPVTCAEPVP